MRNRVRNRRIKCCDNNHYTYLWWKDSISRQIKINKIQKSQSCDSNDLVDLKIIAPECMLNIFENVEFLAAQWNTKLMEIKNIFNLIMYDKYKLPKCNKSQYNFNSVSELYWGAFIVAKLSLALTFIIWLTIFNIFHKM